MKRGLKEEKKRKERKPETKEHFFLIPKVTFLLLALWEKLSGTSGQGRADGEGGRVGGHPGVSSMSFPTQSCFGLTEFTAPLEFQALAGAPSGPTDLLPAGPLSKISLVQTARTDPFLPCPKPTQMDPQTE